MAQPCSHRVSCLSLLELQLVGDGDKDRGMRRCGTHLPAWEKGQGPSMGSRAVQSLCTPRAQLSSALPPDASGLGGAAVRVKDGEWRMVSGMWRVEDGGWKVEDGKLRLEGVE